jgi:ankyrin repeat protein
MRRKRIALIILFLLALLIGGVGLWLRSARRQYALNRALIAALVKNDLGAAIALVNEGADPNTRFVPAPIPTLAELVRQWLHRSGPPVNKSPTAFMMACGAVWSDGQGHDYPVDEHGVDDLRLTQLMVTHGANVNTSEEGGRTPLMDAVDSHAAPAMVRLLLLHGADVNAHDEGGTTPLMCAALSGVNASTVVRLMLQYGSNVNAQDKRGQTALYFAILVRADGATVEPLLAYGSDPNIMDQYGGTPLDVAKFHKRFDQIALLRHYGARK